MRSKANKNNIHSEKLSLLVVVLVSTQTCHPAQTIQQQPGWALLSFPPVLLCCVWRVLAGYVMSRLGENTLTCRSTEMKGSAQRLSTHAFLSVRSKKTAATQLKKTNAISDNYEPVFALYQALSFSIILFGLNHPLVSFRPPKFSHIHGKVLEKSCYRGATKWQQ